MAENDAINQRVTELEKHIKKQYQDFDEQHTKLMRLQEQLRSNQKISEKSRDRLDKLEPHKVEKFMDKIQGDYAALHVHYGLLIFRMSVLESVVWLVSKDKSCDKAFLINAVSALEMPDDWWAAKHNYSLARWVDEIKNLPDAQQRQHMSSGKFLSVVGG